MNVSQENVKILFQIMQISDTVIKNQRQFQAL